MAKNATDSSSRNAAGEINRSRYVAGEVDHQTFYMAVARAIGLGILRTLVTQGIAKKEVIRKALAEDQHLNNIPLAKWDRQHNSMLLAVGHSAKQVMAVSWNGLPLKPGTFAWSLGDTVCTLKSVARDMVECDRCGGSGLISVSRSGNSPKCDELVCPECGSGE